MAVSPTAAVEERLIQASKTLIQKLLPDPVHFPGLVSAQVYDQIEENPDPTLFPAILLSIEGVRETYECIDEVNDAVMRPLVVAIVARNDPKWVQFRPQALLWRQNLIRVFRLGTGQGNIPILPTVPEVVGCWLEPNPVIDPTSKLYQYFRTGFLLKFRCVEPRGVPAQTS